MLPRDELTAWITDLRNRLERGELAHDVLHTAPCSSTEGLPKGAATVTSSTPIRISRRAAMQAWIVRTAPLLLLAACGGPTASTPTTAAPAKPAGAAAVQSPGPGRHLQYLRLLSFLPSPQASASPVIAAGGCVLTPEQTEGPYYIPTDLLRQNIIEDRPGLPLQLTLAVQRAVTCAPVSGATVEVWHCDARGEYSGFAAGQPQTEGEPPGSRSGAPSGTPGPGGPPPGGNPSSPGGGQQPVNAVRFLRGSQVADAGGEVTFQTIYPGWYRGRTVHIHVKVHTGGSRGPYRAALFRRHRLGHDLRAATTVCAAPWSGHHERYGWHLSPGRTAGASDAEPGQYGLQWATDADCPGLIADSIVAAGTIVASGCVPIPLPPGRGASQKAPMKIVPTAIGLVITGGVVVGLSFVIWHDVGRHVVRPRNQRDADVAGITVVGYVAYSSGSGDSSSSGYCGGDSGGGDCGGGGPDSSPEQQPLVPRPPLRARGRCYSVRVGLAPSGSGLGACNASCSRAAASSPASISALACHIAAASAFCISSACVATRLARRSSARATSAALSGLEARGVVTGGTGKRGSGNTVDQDLVAIAEGSGNGAARVYPRLRPLPDRLITQAEPGRGILQPEPLPYAVGFHSHQYPFLNQSGKDIPGGVED